jgi:hypothetical protein
MFKIILIRYIFVFLYLISVFAFAQTANRYPEIKLTDEALIKAKAMLVKENDKRAILTLIKGTMTSPENRTGWMLQIVNKEQFPNNPRQTIEGLGILIPQQNLYSELNGATLDFSKGWWILKKP